MDNSASAEASRQRESGRVWAPPWWSHRPSTVDPYIFECVAVQNEYRLPSRLPPNSLVVDLGGHVGSFSWLCYVLGAGSILSYEPHPDNYFHLQRNLKRFSEVATCIRRAVVFEPTPSSRVLLSGLSTPHNTWAKVDTRGHIRVPSTTFDTLVLSLGRRIDVLKLDIEGSELPILAESPNLGLVDYLAAEVHCENKTWSLYQSEIDKNLKRNGFSKVQWEQRNPAEGFVFARR